MTTLFDPRLHPRDTDGSGRFTETILVDPGQVDLGGPAGSQPQVLEHPEDGRWRISSPRFDGTEYRFDGWPHLLARQNTAIGLLPGREANMARLYGLASAADGPQPVTLLYRDDKGRMVAVEKEVLPGQYDDEDDLPILARNPGDDTYRWLDDDLDLVAVRAGCDAEQMGEWWLDHVANTVPDLAPVTYDGIPEAEWTRRDAPVAAVFMLHGDLYTDERPAGSIFLAQACDRDGMYGQLLVPGQPAREQFLHGADFGGRLAGYTAGSISFADIEQLPSEPTALYRHLAG